MQKKSLLGYGAVVGAMLLFGSIGVVREQIPLPSATLAVLRGGVGAIMLLLFALLSRKSVFTPAMKNKLPFLALSGGMIGLNWVFLFEAYRYTTVATATVCYYAAPLFAALGACLIFRERLTVKKGVCLLCALLGICLVSGVIPLGARISRGVPFALAAATLYAGVMLLNQKLKDLSAYEKTVPQLFFAAAVVLPYALLRERADFTALTLPEWGYTAFLCVLQTGVAYALYFAAYRTLSTLSIGALSYIDPAFAVLLSALALRQSLSPWAWTGAAVTLLAALLFDLPLGRKKEKNPTEEESENAPTL